MIESLVIESCGVNCKLNANKDLINLILNADFTSHYIPDYRINEESKNWDVQVTEDPLLSKKADITFPIASFASGVEFRSIVSLMDYLMERARQEKNGVYCLNSATASYKDSAVIFWGGATNLGKTSSMLELVENRGFEFYSDERTLLNLKKRQIIGGSRTISTRKQILKEKVGELTEFHKHPVSEGIKNSKLFIYPHIDHGLEKPIVYQFEPRDFNWLLSREFGCNIRGAIKYMDDYTYPLPPIDTQELAEKRTEETKDFTKNVPCFYFQGSLTQIAFFVENYFKK